MLKTVFIDNNPYEIDCDMGTQDVAWLAISACYYHGLNNYPVSRYVPCIAHNSKGEYLHPKSIISKYNKLIGDEIYVKVRENMIDPDSSEMTPEERKWSEQAFGIKRFLMEVKIK